MEQSQFSPGMYSTPQRLMDAASVWFVVDKGVKVQADDEEDKEDEKEEEKKEDEKEDGDDDDDEDEDDDDDDDDVRMTAWRHVDCWWIDHVGPGVM